MTIISKIVKTSRFIGWVYNIAFKLYIYKNGRITYKYELSYFIVPST